MNTPELTFTVEKVVAAKAHVCDFCTKPITKGTFYFKFGSRKVGEERFPVVKKVCNLHVPSTLPIGFLFGRPEK